MSGFLFHDGYSEGPMRQNQKNSENAHWTRPTGDDPFHWSRCLPDDPETAVDGVKRVTSSPRPFADPETNSDDENDEIESVPTIIFVGYPVSKLLPHRIVIVVCDLKLDSKLFL